MHHGSQSPCQDLAPGVAGSCGDVPQRGGLGSLNGNEGREVQGVRVHGLRRVNRRSPGCWSASGMDSMALRNTQPTDKAPGAVLRVEPSGGHFALEGASKDRCPTGPPSRAVCIGAGAAWHGAEDALPARLRGPCRATQPTCSVVATRWAAAAAPCPDVVAGGRESAGAKEQGIPEDVGQLLTVVEGLCQSLPPTTPQWFQRRWARLRRCRDGRCCPEAGAKRGPQSQEYPETHQAGPTRRRSHGTMRTPLRSAGSRGSTPEVRERGAHDTAAHTPSDGPLQEERSAGDSLLFKFPVAKPPRT
eukprot:s5342_g2.t1